MTQTSIFTPELEADIQAYERELIEQADRERAEEEAREERPEYVLFLTTEARLIRRQAASTTNHTLRLALLRTARWTERELARIANRLIAKRQGV